MLVKVTDLQACEWYNAACAGKPCFGSLLPANLELFRPCGGSFFAGPGVAVDANGDLVLAAGRADPEELACCLALLGRHCLLTDGPAPAGWRAGEGFRLFGLESGRQLPLPKTPAGFVLNEDPRIWPVAELLFAANPEQRDGWYAEICTKRNHGRGRVWVLDQPRAPGAPVCTVSAAALYAGQAYMACGMTREGLRGQGLGGYLIVRAANALAAEGYRVTFLCREARVNFYTRLGFAPLGALAEYTDLPQEE